MVGEQRLAIKVALYEPEIPPNTGNIIRLCANTGAELDLIGPLGFDLDDKRLRRAGLDYHEFTRVNRYPQYRDWATGLGTRRLLTFSTRARHCYADLAYRPDDALLFGPETRGLPAAVLQSVPESQRLRIPMLAGRRSINLSNAVAVVVFEAWRQQGFAGAA